MKEVDESDVAGDQEEQRLSGNEERYELIKKANQLMRAVKQSVAALDDVLAALKGEKPKGDRFDANGQPTFEFDIKVKLPKGIYLTMEMVTYAIEYAGWERETIETHWNKFKEYYDRCQDKPNGKWSHWRKVWYKWVRTTHERETQGAKPNGAATRFDRAAIRS